MLDKEKKYEIALVLYTSGLDYDDRIRKEILSIQKLYPNVSFKIFAVDNKNREESGVTSYGIPYRIPFLKTRVKYPSGTHTLEKGLDFYRAVKNDLKSYKYIWFADWQIFPFILFLRGKTMLWDLHELPMQFMSKPYMRWLFKILQRKVRVMIHANKPRKDYLESLGLIVYPDRQFILRNYPDFNEIDSEYDETYLRFVEWLGEDKCVYLQGITGDSRADVESLGSVLEVEGLKAVVLGFILPERMKLFEEKFGKQILAERVFFAGQQKQLKTPQYIRKCHLCLVFYKNTSMNNWYCEPNRLFQNIVNGNPVVVGSNPPMKEVVENYGVGVCAETDGRDESKIVSAIENTLDNYGEIKNNLQRYQDVWMWPSQEGTIKRVVELFLTN